MPRKISFLAVVIAALSFGGCNEEKPPTQNGGAPSDATVVEVADREVEASCGTCKLGMEGGQCPLAVRIDGKSYPVDGFTMDQFGNAHAPDGMCNVIRKAKVTGKVVDGRFKAEKFDVLPMENAQGNEKGNG